MKEFIARNKFYLISYFVLAVIYFIGRITNLTDLPIFTDEAIYIRWGQIAKQDAAWRYIALTDGKQPLLIWLMMISLRLFSDPLFAGRIVSVLSGFGSMIGIGVLAYELFGKKRIALFSSLLYLTSPFTLMYDRMALMDSLVMFFSIWSLYLAIVLVRRIRLDIALLLAMSLGGGMLTKTSGFLSMYMLPITLLLFDYSRKNLKWQLLKWLGLVGLAAVLSQIYYSVLRLSPWFHMISEKDKTFIYPFNEWLLHPFQFYFGNMRGLIDWMSGYLTVPIIVLVFIAVLFIAKNWREKLLLLIWSLAPLNALALFGKVLYPRFILFMAMPLLILAAWSVNYLVNRLHKRYTGAILCALLLIYPVFVQLKIIFSIVTAPIPYSDQGQYINDWPAGWGIRESVDILERETERHEITVFTEGTFGLLPYGIEIYLVDDKNIKIIGLWPSPKTYTDEMNQTIATMPTYYIANQFQEFPEEWEGELIAEYQKGNRWNRKLRLYRLLPVLPRE